MEQTVLSLVSAVIDTIVVVALYTVAVRLVSKDLCRLKGRG